MTFQGKIYVAVLVCGAGLVHAQGKKVVVTGLPPAAVEELRSAAPGVSLVSAGRDGLAAEVGDADAILGTISPELVRAGTKLKWAQVYSAGVERYVSPELKSSGIVLTNCKIIQGPNIADHAMALLLSLTRGLHEAIPNRISEEWDRDAYRLVELNGKTAVVIGAGGIGMQIAVRAKAFGMRVIGVDPKDLSYTPALDRLVPPDRLDTVLPEADVVFVAAPHTPRSEKMMGARQFEMLKKGSYFIAVSRGKLYDTDALVKALDSRRLAGAGLDVTDPEPLPKGHPLWKFKNVVITPHIAGGSDRMQERRMALLKENLRRFEAGETLLNVVDTEAGY
jgi:phosphoglycerate dehydrogenase-like enzyme